MEHINKIELQGRVGFVRANEFNGSKVANFSLATDILYKTREEEPFQRRHGTMWWHGKAVTPLT